MKPNITLNQNIIPEYETDDALIQIGTKRLRTHVNPVTNSQASNQN